MTPNISDLCGDAVEERCDPLDELAELDALSEVSEPLRLKRYDLKRKINQFHSLIIRQLPPDVMSTIFEFCLPDFTDHQLSWTTYPEERAVESQESSTTPSSIPLSLGSICSYWREIAWSTPYLWSSLVVRVPGKLDSHVASIAQEWLARSGQLPLSIRIFSKTASNIYSVVSALAGIINQYSTRWYDLDLRVPQYCYHRFHATNNHAPILKFIRIRSPYHSEYTPRGNLKLTCPRLARASLLFFPVIGTDIQCDNLTHLTLHVVYIEDSFRILRKMPQLVFCKVSGDNRRYNRVGALVLTSLRNLQLPTRIKSGLYEIRCLTRPFLNNIIAPHLEEFSFPNYIYYSPPMEMYYTPPMEAITSFLRRSACPLRSFSICFSNYPPYIERFMNLLQSMPPSLNTLSLISIRTIPIYHQHFTPDDYDPRNIWQLVAKVLSSQNTSLQQGFLPNLKTLEFIGRFNLRPENYSDLHSLPPIDNAVHGPFHLLKLKLHGLHPATRLPKSMISYIAKLVERGVTVKVLAGTKDIVQSSVDYYRRGKESPPVCQDWADNLDSSLFS